MLSVTEQVLVTPEAAEKVREFMKEEGRDNAVLRLYITDHGCSGVTNGLALEETPKKDDVIFEQHGITVVVEDSSLNAVKGSVIDYTETPQGPGFKIDNPNLLTTCECRRSRD